MKILVVSPHPDDETLGAGGTIARAKNEGHQIYWLNITGISEDEGFSKEIVEEKYEQLEKINQFFCFDDKLDLRLPTTKLETIPCSEAISYIGNYIKRIEPEVVLISDYNDAHSDHRYVFEWVHASTKVFRYPSIKFVLTMEIVSESNFGLPMNPFCPNIYVDISDYMDIKIQAMCIYEKEIGKHPFPRSIDSIKALACLRGAEAGVRYAEAFRLIKAIV